MQPWGNKILKLLLFMTFVQDTSYEMQIFHITWVQILAIFVPQIVNIMNYFTSNFEQTCFFFKLFLFLTFTT